jgi:hypothetical protein
MGVPNKVSDAPGNGWGHQIRPHWQHTSPMAWLPYRQPDKVNSLPPEIDA